MKFTSYLRVRGFFNTNNTRTHKDRDIRGVTVRYFVPYSSPSSIPIIAYSGSPCHSDGIKHEVPDT